MWTTREELTHQTVTLCRQGMTRRAIARALGISRNTVRKLLVAHARARSGPHEALAAPPARAPRESKLTPFIERITALLARYPEITSQRVFEELRASGFAGGYTAVKTHVRKVRPTKRPEASKPTPVYAAGEMAESDWSPHTIDFTNGTRTTVQVNLGAWMAEHKVGSPVLTAQTRQGPHGSVLEIRVRLPARAVMRGVRATVRVREEAVVENTDGQITSKQHALAERSITLASGGEPGLFSGEIPMAELAGLPQSMPLFSGQVVWQLSVAVQIPWWPDWEDTFTLGAYPGGESHSRGNPIVLTFE